jgi:hypothetical protein
MNLSLRRLMAVKRDFPRAVDEPQELPYAVNFLPCVSLAKEPAREFAIMLVNVFHAGSSGQS